MVKITDYYGVYCRVAFWGHYYLASILRIYKSNKHMFANDTLICKDIDKDKDIYVRM